MIALDTNVLVRFLVEDDPGQTRRAKARIKKAIDTDTQYRVSDIVLCELVWVLQRRYKVDRSEILEKLRRLIRSKHLAFSSVERISTALDAYESGDGDFADYMIREDAREVDCETVITFDKALHEDEGFVDV